MAKRTRVYKRRPGDTRGFAEYRPWMVADIPEDTRETCYPTWEQAMEWATAPSVYREEVLEEEARMDGGW